MEEPVCESKYKRGKTMVDGETKNSRERRESRKYSTTTMQILHTQTPKGKQEIIKHTNIASRSYPILHTILGVREIS